MLKTLKNANLENAQNPEKLPHNLYKLHNSHPISFKHQSLKCWQSFSNQVDPQSRGKKTVTPLITPTRLIKEYK